MPGTGKTFFGKKLAKVLNYPFLDLDEVIEANYKAPISKIFTSEGEPFFRELESQLLRDTANTGQFVLATGGGTPCHHNNLTWMNKMGITVFLESSRDTLISRLSKEDHRPLIQGNASANIDQLLSERLPVYRQAHLQIEHREPELLIQKLKSRN